MGNLEGFYKIGSSQRIKKKRRDERLLGSYFLKVFFVFINKENKKNRENIFNSYF